MDESSVSRQSEPSYVAWMRARAQDARRHQPVIAQRHAQADGSEGPEVHGRRSPGLSAMPMSAACTTAPWPTCGMVELSLL